MDTALPMLPASLRKRISGKGGEASGASQPAEPTEPSRALESANGSELEGESTLENNDLSKSSAQDVFVEGRQPPSDNPISDNGPTTEASRDVGQPSAEDLPVQETPDDKTIHPEHAVETIPGTMNHGADVKGKDGITQKPGIERMTSAGGLMTPGVEEKEVSEIPVPATIQDEDESALDSPPPVPLHRTRDPGEIFPLQDTTELPNIPSQKPEQPMGAEQEPQVDLPEGEKLPSYEESAQDYESEHQHSTTVHGEDHLFDSDHDEDSVELEKVLEHGDVRQQAIAHTETEPMVPGEETEVHINSIGMAQAIPQVVVQGPATPDLPEGAEETEQPGQADQEGGIEAVTSYFEDDDSEPESEYESQPGSQPQESQPEPVKDAPTTHTEDEHTYETSPESTPLLQSTGLPSSRHNPERPQTPPNHQDPTPYDDIMPDTVSSRNTADTPWSATTTDDWTPQSQHTQTTTFSSPPSSPWRGRSAGTGMNMEVNKRELENEPLLHHHLDQTNVDSPTLPSHPPRFRTDDDDKEGDEEEEEIVDDGGGATTPLTLMAPWQGRVSPDLSLSQHPVSHEDNTKDTQHGHEGTNPPNNSGSKHDTTNTGSLLQRMRHIFEPHHQHQPQHPQDPSHPEPGASAPVPKPSTSRDRVSYPGALDTSGYTGATTRGTPSHFYAGDGHETGPVWEPPRYRRFSTAAADTGVGVSSGRSEFHHAGGHDQYEGSSYEGGGYGDGYHDVDSAMSEN